MKILVADDHKLVRDGLKPFLQELAPDVEVLDAANMDEALAAVAGAEGLGLVLLDLMMPGMDGLKGLELLRAKCPDVPVVIVSGFSSRDHVVAAVQAGAAGFIPKTVSGTAMVNALRLVLSGEKYLPSSTFFEEPGSQMSMPSSMTIRPTGVPAPFDKLSRREAEILALLVEGRTNKEIALCLDLQEITIKVHLRNVYRKIGAANRAQAVRIAMSSGWVPAGAA
ncbi:response regulator transcription factor [Magnetospirillum aberrantis]|uniref:Response regulator transcription factor n=1 Tax=Magnetospirillum aberrantis SpK TaxID=908842 RepID=A0A7C9QU51_9PROT|nr:response regulator transcription factor [Magnetospirillum aberrantis]NFV80139.1 response regulator transcription factor [Magnetospirillum aberrantis SpK]